MGRKIKANIALMYVWSITCNKDKIIAVLYAEAAVAWLGSVSWSGQSVSGKLAPAAGSQKRTVKSTRGLENTPCSDKLILLSMNMKEEKIENSLPLREQLLQRGR